MAAATTRDDVETRANNLWAAFGTLENDAKNIERQLRDTSLDGSNNWRVAPWMVQLRPWMVQLRQRLDESRQWINDLRRQTTHHNFMRQADHFEEIQRTVQDADDGFCEFGFVVTHENAVQVLVHLFDCAGDLKREFEGWAKTERQKNANPPQLHAMHHAADMPPATRDNEDEDVDLNPRESLARTGNPYMIM